MRMYCFVTLLVCAAPGFGADSPGKLTPVDLSRISRRIEVHPPCQTDSPTYCLIVFGLKAAHRVWVVRDGDRLFVDRNGDGRMTEAPSSMRHPADRRIELKLPDSGRQYTRLYFRPTSDETCRVVLKAEDRTGYRYQYVGFGAAGPAFGSSPETAPVIHFDGQLTLAQYGQQQILPRRTDGKSYRVTSLRLMVGTPGLGPGTFAACHCRCRTGKSLGATIAWPRGRGTPYLERVAYDMRG